MGSTHARDFDGHEWRVRRRWIPHREGRGVRKRFGGHDGVKRRLDHFDALDVPGLDFGDGIFAAIGAVLLLVVVMFVLVLLVGPIALLGIDLIWLLGALLIGMVGRFVLGHPWRVEATSDDGRRFDWAFQGYGSAGDGRDHIARRLHHGDAPEAISPPGAIPR